MSDAKISDDTVIATPLRNIITIIGAAAVGTWAYFGLIERLNSIETNMIMMTSDLEKNTEFRIKWPRGDMGSLPADAEQFMLIEHLSGQLDKMITDIENGNAPYDQQQKLTLDFYEKRISKLEERVDVLKSNRGN